MNCIPLARLYERCGAIVSFLPCFCHTLPCFFNSEKLKIIVYLFSKPLVVDTLVNVDFTSLHLQCLVSNFLIQGILI